MHSFRTWIPNQVSFDINNNDNNNIDYHNNKIDNKLTKQQTKYYMHKKTCWMLNRYSVCKTNDSCSCTSHIQHSFGKFEQVIIYLNSSITRTSAPCTLSYMSWYSNTSTPDLLNSKLNEALHLHSSMLHRSRNSGFSVSWRVMKFKLRCLRGMGDELYKH